MSHNIYIGNSPVSDRFTEINGEYVDLDGDRFYKISNYDAMRPFFISLVSHSDHWLFISSSGGLSAGRRNDHSALFPYYTDDKISDSSELIGNKAILLVSRSVDRQHLWEPFSQRLAGVYQIQRNMYKNVSGNRLIFEEVNQDLQLTYRYSWEFSEKFGFIKRSSIENAGEGVKVNLVDGLQGILPYGINSGLQDIRSNLANAYKRSELADDRGLGVFALSSMIVDRAEPSEALKASTVWSTGLPANGYLLSSLQLDAFRRSGEVNADSDVKAEVGSFFVHSHVDLNAAASIDWVTAAEVNQDYADVVKIQNWLSDPDKLRAEVDQSIDEGTVDLRKKVALADGLQKTADELSTGRHFSNVLFNIMRGGLFEDQYLLYTDDLKDYAAQINKKVFVSRAEFFNSLSNTIMVEDLMSKAHEVGDVDLIRICREYLPLTFSRRHGDPSRPWNRFSIELKKEDGSVNRQYEGNWRDIFQNWEALADSIPGFINSIIAKFVNASTVDGYNPYRISRDGIDWEVIEPDDPWSYIGYWGDHQIIYLQKLLELSVQHFPDRIHSMLSEESFVYANVPYRIKNYKDIVADPQDTIIFDEAIEDHVQIKVAQIGADGKLVVESNDQLTHANLTEKLLVMVLAKLSNFIPEGGIWLNTQRPEWNDANNALVGNGVSMVTLYYLRRNIAFLKELYADVSEEQYNVHSAVKTLFDELHKCLNTYQDHLHGGFSDSTRKSIVDQLGIAGEHYRESAYAGFSNKAQLNKADLISFFDLSLKYIDQSISVNKREDGLYHAYNLLSFEGDELKIDYLYEMLEGQVSALSAGTFSLKESLAVLDALKSSDIFRPDQYSYMLYPNRKLPKFLERNIIPSSFVEESALAQQLLADGNRQLLFKDAKGAYHFNGTFNNNISLKACLDDLKEGSYASLVEKEYTDYLDIFEEMFDHKSFTGRSGTFFGFEGLGSIYWHMVSKLLLAVQECIWNATDEEKESHELYRMIDHYYEIRAGIGINKSPELYGSFPTDPYSHTPSGKGAQQPGMTGQVKEDILNRWAELGVRVSEGKISFKPLFLNSEEYLSTSDSFEYFDLAGEKQSLELTEGQLAFTYCQVPIVYTKADNMAISLSLSDGTKLALDAGSTMDETNSRKLFERTGEIVRIDVKVNS
ncbi:MAG: hypothetical protein RIF33_00680 [Cyclobacteriaceae bacterium]